MKILLLIFALTFAGQPAFAQQDTITYESVAYCSFSHGKELAPVVVYVTRSSEQKLEATLVELTDAGVQIEKFSEIIAFKLLPSEISPNLFEHLAAVAKISGPAAYAMSYHLTGTGEDLFLIDLLDQEGQSVETVFQVEDSTIRCNPAILK